MPDPPRRPPIAPGIPGAKLPPPRPKQRTIPDGAPPPFDSTLESPPEPRQAAPSQAIDPTDGQRVVLTVEPPQRRPEARSVSPAPWDPRASSPELRREVERHGDRLVQAPTSTPQPSATHDVDLRVGDVRVRVGSSVTRKLLPWLAPVLLSVAGTTAGYLKGYFEGLAAAGRRVAAVEEAVRLNAEGDARHEKKTTLELNRAFVVLDDHDERIPKLEQRVGKVEQRTPKIEGIAPK